MRGVIADGGSLRAIRIDRGLSQEDLADLARLDVKTVRKAEGGGRLDLSTLGRLAGALETVTGRLIRRDIQGAEIHARRRDDVFRWLAAWDARDAEAVMAVYHEDATLRLPGGPSIPFHGTFQGKEDIRRAHQTAWDTCRTEPVPQEDFRIYVTDEVAVMEGHKGVHLPDGRVAMLWCVQIFSFEGDRVIDHRVEYDTLAMLQALGLPASAGAGEARGSSR